MTLERDLLAHPLTTPDWELAQASPIRTDGRALWRTDGDRERIIHGRWVQGVAGPLRLARVGIRRGIGYHKCASAQEYDVPRVVRLLANRDGALAEVGSWTADPLASAEGIQWFDAPLEATTLFAIVEQAAIDGGWSSWNVARTGLVLDGVATTPWRRPPFALLDIVGDAGSQPAPGVTVERRHDEIRYRTDRYAIGFRLRAPALSFLAVDDDARCRVDRDLLQHPRSMDIVRAGLYPAGVYPVLRDPQAASLAQGPRLTFLDGREPAGFLGYDVRGSVVIDGASVSYDLTLGDTGIRYQCAWTMSARGFELTVERSGHAPFDGWISSAWHLAIDTRIAPSTLLGPLVTTGQTGLVRAPATWHHPRHGSFVIEADEGVLLRADAVRPLDTNTLEVKVEETPGADGTYRLGAGGGQHTIRFTAGTPRLTAVRPDAPLEIRRALDRHLVTAMTFRADTGTFSNNGASMHCAGSLNPLGDVVAGLRGSAAGGAAGVDPVGMLARSVERWLAGAPGYGSGASSRGDMTIADEYLMLAADGLYGLGRLLPLVDGTWMDDHEADIEATVDAMRGREVDGDGLIASRIRLGRSGEHQWSTNWADVVSFGWKDAWSNAVLYGALRMLANGLRQHGRPTRAAELDDWAGRLKASYLPAFFNETAGWIGGWRSEDGVLHDAGHPLINGDAVSNAVVDGDAARAIMERVWAGFGAVGYRDFANGVPINLSPIPEADLGGVVFGLPIGGYLQGGATHHRTGGLVRALYRVGMVDQADELLRGLASTTADDTAFGGIGSGVDWRLWDGTPSGYEGMLAEGFGFLAAALDRYELTHDGEASRPSSKG